ncbi:plant nuclear matrix protein [Medicago truncatula]|uniref:Plant nuclear matrix protein n=1 Tax=Medicago truncatula TaxID=3880 RepID=G7JWZ3_MEDTR|nr:plant nuclear matrix protein [Medicago truncatula]
MASKQMEAIQKKLGMLNYPRANASAQSLLFAGMERYALFEWLFFRLLGDKSPFSQQNLQGDALDRDEETARIQWKKMSENPYRDFGFGGWLRES